MTKKKHGKRLDFKNRIKIYNMYKQGISISDIGKQLKCGSSTIYRWKDKEILYKSFMGIKKKHKTHVHIKPHKKHIHKKKHKKHVIPKRKCKYEHLANDIIELYKKHGTLKKVKEELKKRGVSLSQSCISKRIPKEYKKNKKKKKLQ